LCVLVYIFVYFPLCDYSAICCMNGKTIQCLSKPWQHLPIYLKQFSSYWNRKCKKYPFSRTTAYIFVSLATITQYVVWMERGLGHRVTTFMYTHSVLIECGALRQRQLRNFVLAASKTENKIVYTFSCYILFIYSDAEL